MQEQKAKQTGRREEETHAEVSNTDVSNQELAEKTDQVVADIDDVLADQEDDELLADIDDVLEQNAEEFVNNFVQQGGE